MGLRMESRDLGFAGDTKSDFYDKKFREKNNLSIVNHIRSRIKPFQVFMIHKHNGKIYKIKFRINYESHMSHN